MLKEVVESKIKIWPLIEYVLVSERKVFSVVKLFWFSRRKVSAILFDSQRPNISTHFTQTFVLQWPNILLNLPNIWLIYPNITQVKDFDYLGCGSPWYVVSKSRNVGQNEQNVGLQEDKCSVKTSQNVRSFRAKMFGLLEPKRLAETFRWLNKTGLTIKNTFRWLTKTCSTIGQI